MLAAKPLPPYKAVKCNSVKEMQAVVDFVREPRFRWTVSEGCGPIIELERPGYEGCHASENYHRKTGNSKIISYQDFERDYLKKQSTGSSPTESFILPEKWYIKITDENRAVLNDFKLSKGKNRILTRDGVPCDNYFFVDYEGFGLSENYGENYNGSYKLITFDQFKKYVLKQNDTSILFSDKTPTGLLEEAKRRYPIGTKFKPIGDPLAWTKSEYVVYDELIWQHDIGISHVGIAYVYLDGQWAEIIENVKTNAVPEYVEVINSGQSYTTHSDVPEIGIENYDYGNAATSGEIYKVIKEEVERTNESSYVLKSYSGKGYLIGKSGCKPSTKEAYERQHNKDWKPSYIDIETAPLRTGGINPSQPWYDVEEDRAMKEFLNNPNALGYVISKPRQFGATDDLVTAIGYNILAQQNFKSNISPSVKPSSKVSVKSHEEFKINIIKPKTIKL